MIVKLIRNFPTDKQTVGKLFVINQDIIEFDCHTLELGWHGNKKDISCIPIGEYTIKKRFSDKYGEHWHIQNVPDRDMILIHTGNYAGSNNPRTNEPDTHGCILIGLGLADINGDGYMDVTESKNAMEQLNEILTGQEYKLIVK